MIKLLPCRFGKCLGRFDMLTAEECSETELFEDLPNHVFHNLKFSKCIGYESHPFFQNV